MCAYSGHVVVAVCQRMAEQGTKFIYRNIELYKYDSLGSGSYGGVCKARCDGLTCAAKILHPTLFDMQQPGSFSYLQKFKEECHLLSLARHPNVVQYLATYSDPDTGLPVLLMELCDESLTAFLERSPKPLSYHYVINICHDIALALVYLHSNGLIHRDLTGNNVLMISGPRAKITDFGMSKFAAVNPRITALTMCPGNRLYMSPEALDEAKAYTAKLDVFSFGVIIIQILTRQFPNPCDRFRLVSVPNFEEPVRVVVPETERRKDHLNLIPDDHPLKPQVLECLKKENERPSALTLSERLSAEFKQSSQYTESLQESSNSIQRLELQVQEMKAKTVKMEEYQTKVTELQRLLDARNIDIEKLECTKVTLVKEKDNAITTMHSAVEEKEKALTQVEKQLQLSEQLVSKLQKSLQEKDKVTTKLHQTSSSNETSGQQQLEQKEAASGDKPPELPPSPRMTVTQAEVDTSKMTWREGENAPETMVRGAAVVHGNTAYFRPAGSHKVYSYQNLQGKEHWHQLPINTNCKFGLAVIDDLLTSVGGINSGVTLTNTLLSLVPKESGEKKWSEIFPPMPTPRRSTACITTNHIVVVAGGVGTDYALNTVEVMNIYAKQWTTAFPLPQKIWQFSGTVVDNRLYLSGGYSWSKASKSVFTCSLSSFSRTSGSLGSRLRSPFSRHQTHTPWKEISCLPVTHSTLVTVGGSLLAVGGKDDSEMSTSNVYQYDRLSDSWSVAHEMVCKRSWCLAVTLPEDHVVVVGGVNEVGCNTRSTETLEKNDW